MSTLIQCPACSQKFNLQGRLPALFTCTKCQQPMDLTGFPGYVPEEPAAPAPSRGAAPSRGGSKSSGSSSRGRRRSREEEEEDDRRARFEPKKSNQGLLIWGLVGGLLVIVVVVFILWKKKDTTVPRTAEEAAAAGGAGAPVAWTGAPGTSVPGTPTPVPGTPGPSSAAPGSPTPGTTAPGAPGTPAPAPDPAAGKPKGSLALKTWQSPEDVTKEDQQRIDQALETALNQVGIEQRQAEKTLVGMGRKAIWRLVSEFKHIQDTDTFEGRKGLIKAMITDRILRKIDGHMERNTGYKMPINPESTLEYSTGVAKQWNGWLERGLYKKELPPWDDRVDGQDEPKEKPAPKGGR